MNAVGFDASPLGNHEFDAGTSTLGVLIAADARGAAGPAADRYVGTLFPYLSANLGFSNDYSLNSLFSAAPVDATSNGGANTIAPMAAFTVEGDEKVAGRAPRRSLPPFPPPVPLVPTAMGQTC